MAMIRLGTPADLPHAAAGGHPVSRRGLLGWLRWLLFGDGRIWGLPTLRMTGDPLHPPRSRAGLPG